MSIDTVAEYKEFSWDAHELPSEFVKPPDPGIYTFKKTDDDPVEGEFEYDHGKRKAQQIRFKVAIQGGPSNGRTTFASANTMLSMYRVGHSAADFLMSAKSSLRPKTETAFIDAVRSTHTPFNAKTRWEWYCKDCGDTFLVGGPKNAKPPKKYGKLPASYKVAKNEDKTFHFVQACPDCKQPIGANLGVGDFVVAAGIKTAVVPPATKAPSDLPPAAG
jgi:hypothetical protein